MDPSASGGSDANCSPRDATHGCFSRCQLSGSCLIKTSAPDCHSWFIHEEKHLALSSHPPGRNPVRGWGCPTPALGLVLSAHRWGFPEHSLSVPSRTPPDGAHGQPRCRDMARLCSCSPTSPCHSPSALGKGGLTSALNFLSSAPAQHILLPHRAFPTSSRARGRQRQSTARSARSPATSQLRENSRVHCDLGLADKKAFFNCDVHVQQELARLPGPARSSEWQ